MRKKLIGLTLFLFTIVLIGSAGQVRAAGTEYEGRVEVSTTGYIRQKNWENKLIKYNGSWNEGDPITDNLEKDNLENTSENVYQNIKIETRKRTDAWGDVIEKYFVILDENGRLLKKIEKWKALRYDLEGDRVTRLKYLYDPTAGEAQYLFDVCVLDQQFYFDKGRENPATKAKIKFEVQANELTNLLNTSADPTAAFNRKYYLDNAQATDSDISSMKFEISSIPFRIERGSFEKIPSVDLSGLIDGSLGTYEVVVDLTEKGRATFFMGSHSISWSVSSQTDWEANTSSRNEVFITENGSLKLGLMDRFEGGDMSDWSYETGSYSTTDSYSYDENYSLERDANSESWRFLERVSNPNNQKVTVWGMSTSNASGYTGASLNIQDGNTGYLVGLNIAADYIDIFEITDGGHNNIKENPVSLSTGTWYKMVAWRDGDTLYYELYKQDGTQLISDSVTDTTHSGGGVGVGSYRTDSYCDRWITPTENGTGTSRWHDMGKTATNYNLETNTSMIAGGSSRQIEDFEDVSDWEGDNFKQTTGFENVEEGTYSGYTVLEETSDSSWRDYSFATSLKTYDFSGMGKLRLWLKVDHSFTNRSVGKVEYSPDGSNWSLIHEYQPEKTTIDGKVHYHDVGNITGKNYIRIGVESGDEFGGEFWFDNLWLFEGDENINATVMIDNDNNQVADETKTFNLENGYNSLDLNFSNASRFVKTQFEIETINTSKSPLVYDYQITAENLVAPKIENTQVSETLIDRDVDYPAFSTVDNVKISATIKDNNGYEDIDKVQIWVRDNTDAVRIDGATVSDNQIIDENTIRFEYNYNPSDSIDSNELGGFDAKFKVIDKAGKTTEPAYNQMFKVNDDDVSADHSTAYNENDITISGTVSRFLTSSADLDKVIVSDEKEGSYEASITGNEFEVSYQVNSTVDTSVDVFIYTKDGNLDGSTSLSYTVQEEPDEDTTDTDTSGLSGLIYIILLFVGGFILIVVGVLWAAASASSGGDRQNER